MDYILPEDYTKLKEDPANLFSAIYNIKDKEKRKQILIDINHKDNVDICEYAFKAIENGHNALYLNALLGDIIGELKLNKESLLKYFKIVNQSLQGALFSSTQYLQIQSITVKQPNFAEEFLEYLSLLDGSFVFECIVEIILSLNKISLAEKHSRLLLMANSNNESKSICGINGLGRIEYPAEDSHELLNQTLSCFDSHIRQEHHMINGAITMSLRFLFSFGDKINLINLSKTNDPYILIEIVRFLYFEYKKISREYYFKTLLFSLTKINSDQIGIIKELDMLLYSMIESEFHIDLFIQFLLAWTKESDCEPDKIASLQILDMTFSGIQLKSAIFQKILLQLFKNDNILAPQLAVIIIAANALPMERAIYFDQNSLSILDDMGIIFICRRVLGYIIHLKTMISLFYSILLAKKDNKKIVDFICSCFIEYIGYNFPKTTIEFIEGILNCTGSDKSCIDILLTILDEIKQIDKERTEKHRFKELESSRGNYYLLYKEEWRKGQKTISTARKKSILDFIGSTSHIKYGKTASYYMNGNITESASFKGISFSMEMAYDYIIDPVRFNKDVYYFRTVTRNANCN